MAEVVDQTTAGEVGLPHEQREQCCKEAPPQVHLTCASCLEFLGPTPYTLPCGWTICRYCVPQAAESNEFSAVRCPARSCRRRHFGIIRCDWTLRQISERATLLLQDQGWDFELLQKCHEFVMGPISADYDESMISSAAQQMPFTQVVWLASARVKLALGNYEEALSLADVAHRINPWNRRGISMRRIIELRAKEASVEVQRRESPPTSPSIDEWSYSSTRQNSPRLSAIGYQMATEDDKCSLECPLCLNVLEDPVTLQCGHTACRKCLLVSISLSSSSSCCMCRYHLPSYTSMQKRTSNFLITSLLRQWGLDTRTKNLDPTDPELLNWTRFLSSSIPEPSIIIPLFLLNTVTFPGTRHEFHIFEPRYRAMVKECTAKRIPFGIGIPKPRSFNPFSSPSSSYFDIGMAMEIDISEPVSPTELEDTALGPLPRYFIQAKASFRFKIIDESPVPASPDNLYYVRAVRLDDVDFNDLDAANGDPPFNPIEYMENAQKIRRVVDAILKGLDPLRRSLVTQSAGAMPDDNTLLAFWLAQWMPMPSQKKLEILASPYPHERMRLISQMLGFE